MKILIEAPFKMTEIQDKAIRDNLSELDKYNQGITQANVYFKEDDGNTQNGIEAKIQLHIPGPVIFVSDEDQDAMLAFKKAFDKVDRQLKKTKDIKQSH